MPQPPMIQLDPAGKAPILSYNLSEPVAYSGRNYIQILLAGMTDDWFQPVAAPPDETPGPRTLARSPTKLLGPLNADKLAELTAATGARIIRETEQPIGQLIVPPDDLHDGRVRGALASLTTGDVQAMTALGQDVQIYRSPFTGNLTYRMKPRDPNPEDEAPSSAKGVVKVIVTITEPVRGAVVTGPAAGIRLPVSGDADVFLGGDADDAIASVEVSIDGQRSEPAKREGSAWSFEKEITVAGRHSITAIAKTTGGKYGNAETYVDVLLSNPNPDDKTPPALEVNSPRNGDKIVGAAGAYPIKLAGSASDPSGVDRVLILIDRDGAPETTATPRAQDDWSSWTATVAISSPGQHTILVRAFDKKGNTAEHKIEVFLSPVPVVAPGRPRLYLVESCTLSSFLGSYGAGRVLKTFTLLPGEKTKISVRTFSKREQDRKEASSILDSLTNESAGDFEKTLEQEQSSTKDFDESFSYKVNVEGSATWGWGSARVDAGVSGGSNAARHEFAKNITNATTKHVQKCSAKREVQINTSYEEKTTTEEENSFERIIENVNVSRTLNFVFRQMNQEFITLLHLTDVRVAYLRVDQIGDDKPQLIYREATLPQLEAFVEQVIKPDFRERVKQAIIEQLKVIWDYHDTPHDFTEEKSLLDAEGQPIPNSGYLRVRKSYFSKYKDDATGTEIPVPGIILAATKNVLRTEGVIVDAVLGNGEALDEYSKGLQAAAVDAKRAANAREAAEAERLHVANEIVRNGNAALAELYIKVFPCCPDVALAPVPVVAADDIGVPHPRRGGRGQPAIPAAASTSEALAPAAAATGGQRQRGRRA